jgi:hypothetical protein
MGFPIYYLHRPATDSNCNTKYLTEKSELIVTTESWIELHKPAPLRTFALFNSWLDVTPREEKCTDRENNKSLFEHHQHD